jgi:hypothetical protein
MQPLILKPRAKVIQPVSSSPGHCTSSSLPRSGASHSNPVLSPDRVRMEAKKLNKRSGMETVPWENIGTPDPAAKRIALALHVSIRVHSRSFAAKNGHILCLRKSTGFRMPPAAARTPLLAKTQRPQKMLLGGFAPWRERFFYSGGAGYPLALPQASVFIGVHLRSSAVTKKICASGYNTHRRPKPWAGSVGQVR